MYHTLEQTLRAAVRDRLRALYPDAAAPPLVVESPPRPELGDYALPVCFELARQLKRQPRQIAQELAATLPLPAGFARVEVAGAGYLNFFVDRAAAFAALFAGGAELSPSLGKVIVEHTNINPNKAAHIGHLRNAVLGDTWVRLLRHRGETVEVQNLQDNTGVQVADVAIAFLHLGGETSPAAALAAVVRAIADPAARFDYLCWDKYAEVSANPELLQQQRPSVLAQIEAGGNPVADLAEAISTAIAEAHLRTMERIDARYDVLPRESEILRLRFWEQAFALLRERGAVRLETEGKNQGCWVMDRPGDTGADGEEESKVIVRSTGTVTYVGKDIAYQMWKFGLLPLDFGYRRFHRYPDGTEAAPWAWTTAVAGEPDPPAFGRGDWVFNVIDVRQSYLQEIVVAGLRALGNAAAAERSVHFSYEMVALTPACAAELGYAAAADEKRVDVSGRKGTGVKADDLLDRLEAHTRAEVGKRHPEMEAGEQARAARQIAAGALRYFLLKYTRTTVIAFDFKEALSFEGETGPYVQYAAVRAANILRKAAGGLPEFAPGWGTYLEDDAIWSLLWLAGRLDAAVEQCIAAREPAHLAKYAFQLAQAFSNFYHHHPVLQAADQERREFLLAVVEVARRQLTAALGLMGIETPTAM